MKPKPVCFVAMAFNKEDTDAIYEDHILPVLKRNGVKAVIINRRQSNQDLNIQIIDQLRKADFCITDLTYARQSVYFEAGFAERDVDVIYTARKDHLDDGQPDHLRVHFDLQMKPIIIWKSRDDYTFAKKLEKRLKSTVLKDWEIRRRDLEKAERAKALFASRSQSERLSLIRRRTIARLKKFGHKIWITNSRRSGSYSYESIHKGFVNNIISQNNDSKYSFYTSVQSYSSATKSILKHLRVEHDISSIYRGFERSGLTKDKPIITNHFVLSLRAIPQARIEDVFPWHTPQVFPTVYSLTSSYKPYGYKRKNTSIPVISNWHLISGIDSEITLRSMLLEHIQEKIFKMPA